MSKLLENGPFKNIIITDGFYMQYFNPTINFNMLQYTSSSNSKVPADLRARLLVDFNDLIISDRSKHTMDATLQDDL